VDAGNASGGFQGCEVDYGAHRTSASLSGRSTSPIASNRGEEEWLEPLQTSVSFDRAPVCRFTAGLIKRRTSRGAPDDAEEGEARREAREHLVVPKSSGDGGRSVVL
jgi:hypothetical protein